MTLGRGGGGRGDGGGGGDAISSMVCAYTHTHTDGPINKLFFLEEGDTVSNTQTYGI